MGSHSQLLLAMSYPGKFSSSNIAGDISSKNLLGLEKTLVTPARRKVSCVVPGQGGSHAVTPYHVKTVVLLIISFVKSSFIDLPNLIVSSVPEPPVLTPRRGVTRRWRRERFMMRRNENSEAIVGSQT